MLHHSTHSIDFFCCKINSTISYDYLWYLILREKTLSTTEDKIPAHIQWSEQKKQPGVAKKNTERKETEKVQNI